MKRLDIDLILEGGGVRCLFTHGIIDYFLHEGIFFNSIYGVSAGSLAGALYKSRQENFIPELLKLIAGKDLISSSDNLSDIYEILKNIDENIIDFDFESFTRSEEKLYIVVLNAISGQTEYLDSTYIRSKDDLFYCLAASCSIPGVAKSVKLGEKVYYDGGFSDPIPVFKSFSDKKNKKTIVLTREKSYYKEFGEGKEDISHLVPYDKVLYSMDNRYVKYNDSKVFSLYMEENNDAVVLMPSFEVKLDCLDLNTDKLLDLYKDGYSQSMAKLDSIVGLND